MSDSEAVVGCCVKVVGSRLVVRGILFAVVLFSSSAFGVDLRSCVVLLSLFRCAASSPCIDIDGVFIGRASVAVLILKPPPTNAGRTMSSLSNNISCWDNLLGEVSFLNCCVVNIAGSTSNTRCWCFLRFLAKLPNCFACRYLSSRTFSK